MYKSEFSKLSVSPDATTLDIKRAYRKLAIHHHPDKGGDPEKFSTINKAYESIMNQRAANDRNTAPLAKMTFSRRRISIDGVIYAEKTQKRDGLRVEISKPKSSY